MDISWWFLNLAYAVYVVSPVFKEMLKLRLVLLAATVLFIAYGLTSGVMSVTWWNIPFGLMHIYQIALLFKDRLAPPLPDAEEQVRELLFPTLNGRDFSELWNLGVNAVLEPDEVIIRSGEDLDEVMLLVEGAADVSLRDGESLRLRPMALLGEMSFVNGGPATADVVASGPTVVRRWQRAELLDLGKRKPHVRDAALLLIGRQLAKKVRV